jgi:hypothetical protein
MISAAPGNDLALDDGHVLEHVPISFGYEQQQQYKSIYL